MPRSILLTDTPQPSTPLLTLLESHLPHSLPVLRRLQFALKFLGGSTPHTHVLYARYDDDDNNNNNNGEEQQQQTNGEGAGERRGTRKGHFAAACVDLSRAPETEVWVYSSLEDGVNRGGGCIAAATESRRKEDGAGMKVLIGSLHETVRQGLLARGVEMDKSANIGPELDWEFCGKWLFRVEDLPVAGDEGLPEGMRWDRAMKADVETIRARSSINRQE
ncbi:hypothetical protein NEMBOFW57_003068 [Staphylotrichum longicolle]|uniref:Uncharacterized protein n=1 Tax=Staphylotrichum longicolle TaxID=669026 RepID=A0AAD4F405_9PEZI|nr:hypothetical protein NEMBOFW57_003068 [Staphylotrichum longicolle]